MGVGVIDIAYDLTFLLQNPLILKNVDVCKQLELNLLRFDQGFKLKKNIFRLVVLHSWPSFNIARYE